MSRNRFSDLTATLSLRTPDADLTHKDPFWEIHEMQTAFNRYVHKLNSKPSSNCYESIFIFCIVKWNMKEVFSPSWGVCLDESMVKWLNEYAPGWTVVGRKPSPFSNEYHKKKTWWWTTLYFSILRLPKPLLLAKTFS